MSAKSSFAGPTAAANARRTLARLTALTSSLPGLDASLMLVQYSSPIIISLLLRLARFRAARPRVAFPGSTAKAGAGGGLVRLAEGLGKGAVAVGDARTIFRAAGLLPILQWVLSLHPAPLQDLLYFLKSPHKLFLLASPKTLSTLQAISLMLYYPLEHLGWLGAKGIVPLSPGRIKSSIVWSVRFWALYVLLDIVKLSQNYSAIKARVRKLKKAKAVTQAEGYEIQDPAVDLEKKAALHAEVVALKKDSRAWQLATLKDAGYAPLTIHWSGPGLWEGSVITGAFGTVAAIASWLEKWEATA